MKSYKILHICPTPAYSHQGPHVALVKALAAAGHEVTFITTNPFETTSPNIRQINVDFLYGQLEKLGKTLVHLTGWKKLFAIVEEMVLNNMEEIFSFEEVKNLLDDKNQQFDAIIVENLGYTTSHALAEKYNATLIGITSLEIWPLGHNLLGNPAHPLLNPGVQFVYPENPNIFTRMKMLYNHLDFMRWTHKAYSNQDHLIKRFFPEVKLNSFQLQQRLDLVIECTSPALGFVRPTLPNTKQIGFLHVQPLKPLPEDLQEFLDSSKRGVIYLSFGSGVRSSNMEDEFLKKLKAAVRSLPYDVLWKFEAETMPDKPENVKLMKWVPQQDLLAHPNLKLFITQAGMQSFEETVLRGVPVVVVPCFGDQFWNGVQMERLGIGKKIFQSDLTEENFASTILEVITDPKYKKSALELSRQAKDTPMSPTDTAVWHIEHAVRNRGAEMFKYRGKTISFYQYYFMDVAALTFGALGLVAFGILKLIR